MVAQSWNKHREDALSIAVNKILIPKLSVEIKAKLLEESKECVLNQYYRKIGVLINHPMFDFNYSQRNSKANASDQYTDQNTDSKTNNIANDDDDLWNMTDATSVGAASIAASSITAHTEMSESQASQSSAVFLQKKMDKDKNILCITYSLEFHTKSVALALLNSNGKFIESLILPNFDYGRTSSQSKIILKVI